MANIRHGVSIIYYSSVYQSMKKNHARKSKRASQGKRFFRNAAPARTLGALVGPSKVAAWRVASEGVFGTTEDRVRSVMRNYAIAEGRI